MSLENGRIIINASKMP